MSKPTTVVCCWSQPFDVYIGRDHPRHGKDVFGNPFALRNYSGKHARKRCLADYRAYFLKRVAEDAQFRARVLALRGKVLGCFCAKKAVLTASDPHVCHGQVIAEWVDAQPVESFDAT